MGHSNRKSNYHLFIRHSSSHIYTVYYSPFTNHQSFLIMHCCLTFPFLVIKPTMEVLLLALMITLVWLSTLSFSSSCQLSTSPSPPFNTNSFRCSTVPYLLPFRSFSPHFYGSSLRLPPFIPVCTHQQHSPSTIRHILSPSPCATNWVVISCDVIARVRANCRGDCGG